MYLNIEHTKMPSLGHSDSNQKFLKQKVLNANQLLRRSI